MSHSHNVALVELIKRGTKHRFISDVFGRTPILSAFVANHHQPDGHGPCIVSGPRVKCAERDFFPVVEDPEIFSVEIPHWQAIPGVLADNIYENQGSLDLDGRRPGTGGLLRKTHRRKKQKEEHA